jgi:hypothetical protein
MFRTAATWRRDVIIWIGLNWLRNGGLWCSSKWQLFSCWLHPRLAVNLKRFKHWQPLLYVSAGGSGFASWSGHEVRNGYGTHPSSHSTCNEKGGREGSGRSVSLATPPFSSADCVKYTFQLHGAGCALTSLKLWRHYISTNDAFILLEISNCPTQLHIRDAFTGPTRRKNQRGRKEGGRKKNKTDRQT